MSTRGSKVSILAGVFVLIAGLLIIAPLDASPASAAPQSPAITSASSTTFSEGVADSFTVNATGSPTPSLNETGALPAGVTFVDNGDGTATLAGKPTTDGTYPITFTATNGVGSPATQTFTLSTLAAAAASHSPAITSASSTTFSEGAADSFTVNATGSPRPSLKEDGALPAGVTFVDNGDGTASLAGKPTTDGTYPITFTATNGVGRPATQTFTLSTRGPTTSSPPSNPSSSSASHSTSSSASNPTITGVSFGGTQTSPTITVSGLGFGTQGDIGTPNAASTTQNCSPATGYDYGSNLYIWDQTDPSYFVAGLGPPNLAAVGVITSTYTNSEIVFTPGSCYGQNGWTFAPGDSYTMYVLGSSFSGVVSYPTSIPTTTDLVETSSNPSVVSQSASFTATVKPTPGGGTMGFSDNGAVIEGCSSQTLTGGVATCDETLVTVGAHNIVATYSGATGFAESVSTPLTAIVTQDRCKALANCDLSGLNLMNAHLVGANLTAANLKGANLQRADLTDADLRRDNLKGVTGVFAGFTDADLRGANLENANLTYANLSHTNLQKANLQRVNLTDANLRGAKLQGAKLKNVTWSNTTCPSGISSGLVTCKEPDGLNDNDFAYYSDETDPGTVGFGGAVTFAEGSWVQPALTCPATEETDAAFWVGIDGGFGGGGSGDLTLEQDGTTASCYHGTATYSCFWEMVPFNFAQQCGQDQYPVAPDDEMTAEVCSPQACTDGNYPPGTWNLVVSDVSDTHKNWTFVKSISDAQIDAMAGWPMDCSYTATAYSFCPEENSGEWVVEDPQVDYTHPPLANFGSVTFYNMEADVGGVLEPGAVSCCGNPPDLGTGQSNISVPSGQADVGPLQLQSGLPAPTSSFTITYIAPPPVTAQRQVYSTQINTTLSEPPGTLENGATDQNSGATWSTANEVTGPTHGTLAVNSDGSFTYTPATGYCGDDSFTYDLDDSYGVESAPAPVLVDVVPKGGFTCGP